MTAIGGGHLFRNDGKGHFEDVTEAVNAQGPNGWLTGAAFLDIENDGDLDLFIAQLHHLVARDRQGAGIPAHRARAGPTARRRRSAARSARCCATTAATFVDISESAGIQVRTPDLKVPLGKSLGVAPYDVDGDGLVDIAVANDTVQNFFFHNKGGGKFEEMAIMCGRRVRPVGLAARRHGHRLGPVHERRAARPGRRQLRQRDDGALRLRPADVDGVLRPGQPLRPGRPDAAAAQVRPVLLRLRPRRPPRPALGQRPPRARDLQGAGQRTLRAAGAALLELGQTRAIALRAGQARQGRPRPVPARSSAAAAPTPTSTATATSTSSSPSTTARPASSATTAATRTTGSASSSPATARPPTATPSAPRSSSRPARSVCRRQLFPSKSYLSSVELPLTFGLGQIDHVDEVTITWPSGKVTQPGLKADRVLASGGSAKPLMRSIPP